MPYQLTKDMITSISDLEVVFGTVQYLPAKEDIPPEFYGSNQYTRFVSDLFYEGKLNGDGTLELIEPFVKEDGADMLRFLSAHLASWEPKHEHKIAGMAYALSLFCKLPSV